MQPELTSSARSLDTARESPKSMQAQGAMATPAAGGAAPNPNPPAKTPWRTPPPVFDEADTPAAASGWQELCGADEAADGARRGACCAHLAMAVLLLGRSFLLYTAWPVRLSHQEL